jgi:hypothetical protein
MYNACVFVDYDGTCVKHKGNLQSIILEEDKILPGVLDKFQEWRNQDVYVVITTARPESLRSTTIESINRLGLWFDQIIFGLPTSARYVINDTKPAKGENPPLRTAYGVPIERNTGLSGLDLIGDQS